VPPEWEPGKLWMRRRRGVSFNSQWLDETIVHDEQSADEERSGVSRAELEKPSCASIRAGILKIGKAPGIGTGTVQRVLMEQPRPFDVGVAEAALLR
jgi:hypothetical protein